MKNSKNGDPENGNPEASWNDKIIDRMIEIEMAGGSVKKEITHHRLRLTDHLLEHLPEDPVTFGAAVVEERDKLIQKFPDERELIEKYAIHVLASYNVLLRYCQGLNKSELRNLCLLIDRFSGLSDLSPELSTEIMEIRKKVLFDIIERNIIVNKKVHLDPDRFGEPKKRESLSRY